MADNPTYPDNIKEIPNIFFNRIKDITLFGLQRDKRNTSVVPHGVATIRLCEVLKELGVDYID